MTKLISKNFNINYTSTPELLDNFCLQYGLTPRIRAATRIASNTCIDNFLSNIEGVYAVSDTMIADHLAIIAKLIVSTERERKQPQKYKYRVMKEANWLVFNHGVHNLNIRGSNVEEKWDNLTADIKLLVDRSFPQKQCNRKFIFTMSQGLLKSRDKKNKLLKQYKQGRISKDVYLNYNKVYRKLIKTEQAAVFNQKLRDSGTDGKKKWKAIKSSLHLETSNEKVTEIKIGDRLLHSETEIALAFKTHFETCAKNLAKDLPDGHDTSVVMAQGNPWGLKHTTSVELFKIIRSLKNKNSSGFDNLSNRMLKKEAYRFSIILKDLINESIDTGVFPNCLKQANIIPVFKKGERNNLNNYRPIALLPVLSKVFEKVLNQQITEVIDNGFIDDNQFGFRKSFSTEDAALKFVDQIERDLSNGKHVVSIYVDVSKAFDSCDHSIIIKKLRRTGLNEQGIKLMESYLHDRTQNVSVDGIGGGSFIVNIGVGQGTVLGPTLFKIYIMDMHLYTKMFCMKFADDSSFENSGRTKDEVETSTNAELEKVAEWFKNNKLTLHPNKSRYIVHSKDKLIKLFLSGTEMMRCGYGLQEESVRLLGLNIDENLDWKVHISSVKKKIAKGQYLLWRHRKKLDISTRKVIYESFVRCHIIYCLVVWGGARQNIISSLVSSLKKAWKNMSPRPQHTLNRLKQLNILQLEDEITIQESKFVWRWNSKKLPRSLMTVLKEKNDNLRGRRFETSITAKPNCISSRLSRLASLKITNLATFKTRTTMANNLRKEIISSKYSVNCRRRNCYICGR